MAGHSKWANIKHRKGRMDEQKGKIFTKLSREIFVAAKEGGGDPQTNFRLRMAIEKGKGANLPNDNIQRSIQKGLGNIEGVSYDTVYYEGYGPAGVAMLVESLTDNRNRTVSEVRAIFSKNEGNLGEAGCVSWMFDRKGLITVNNDSGELDEEDLMLESIEAGAEDLRVSDSSFEIITQPEDMESVSAALESMSVKVESAELTMLPQNTVTIDDAEVAKSIIKLMTLLDENDDVQNVYANFDIPDSLEVDFD